MLSTYPWQMGLILQGTFQKWAAKSLLSYPGTVPQKVQGTFLAILVMFWGPILAAKTSEYFSEQL